MLFYLHMPGRIWKLNIRFWEGGFIRGCFDWLKQLIRNLGFLLNLDGLATLVIINWRKVRRNLWLSTSCTDTCMIVGGRFHTRNTMKDLCMRRILAVILVKTKQFKTWWIDSRGLTKKNTSAASSPTAQFAAWKNQNQTWSVALPTCSCMRRTL